MECYLHPEHGWQHTLECQRRTERDRRRLQALKEFLVCLGCALAITGFFSIADLVLSAVQGY